MEIGKIAIKNSAWAWNNLREARNLNYQIGEESLTDFIVLNIKKWGAGKVAIKTFTRNAEALNGSDWEWWFTGPSGKWLGMRVQAKVINLASQEFEHLHYKNKHGSQVDLLIGDAKKKGLIPLYCMYTNWVPGEYKVSWKCQSYKPTVRHYGTSILSPKKVKKLQKKNRKHLSSIIKSLRPMHCIFCCLGYGKGDLPVRALSWLDGAGLLDTDENSQENHVETYLRGEAPYYVYQLLEDSIQGDFVDVPDERLKRVTVFNELVGN